MSDSGQRKKLFVDAKVQGALLRQLIKHWVLACLVTIGYLLVLETLGSGFSESWTERVGRVWQRYAPLAVVVITMFPVFLYDSMRLSHRFAGPMLSIKKNLHRLSAGQLIEPLRFREGDFWQEITNDFNRVAERLGLISPSTTNQRS